MTEARVKSLERATKETVRQLRDGGHVVAGGLEVAPHVQLVSGCRGEGLHLQRALRAGRREGRRSGRGIRTNEVRGIEDIGTSDKLRGKVAETVRVIVCDFAIEDGAREAGADHVSLATGLPPFHHENGVGVRDQRGQVDGEDTVEIVGARLVEERDSLTRHRVKSTSGAKLAWRRLEGLGSASSI